MGLAAFNRMRAAANVAPVPAPDSSVDFNSMTDDEIRAYASANNIVIPPSVKKRETLLKYVRGD